MQIAELQQKTTEELVRLRDEQHHHLRTLRFKAKENQLSNVASVGKTKRSIARINTVLAQREQGADNSAA